MRRYIICDEEKCYRDMRKVLHLRLYNNDVYIAYNVFLRDKK